MKIDLNKLSMEDMFKLVWIVVILSVMLVMILGQFLTTILLCVAIVAFIYRTMGKEAAPKK